MEEELAPTWTHLMCVVGVLVVAHPEFYGSLTKHLRDGIGNDDAALVHFEELIGALLGNLQHDRIGGCRLLLVLPCLIDSLDGKCVRSTISRREISLAYRQLGYTAGALIDMIACQGKTGGLWS